MTEALKDPGSCDRALAGLAALGPEAAPTLLPALLEKLRLARKNNVFEVGGIARAIGRIGPGAADAVPALRKLIKSIDFVTDTDEDVEAARALGRIGPAAGDALPELVGLLLKYPDPARGFGWFNSNAVIVRALERVTAGNPDKMVPHLAKALRLTPPNMRMRRESGISNGIEFDGRIGVVEMIGRLGPRARGTAAALRAILAEPVSKYPQDLLRPAAAEALWRVEGRADDALAVLIAGLTEQFDLHDPHQRLRGVKEPTVRDWLTKNGVKDPLGSTRRGAAAALGRIGEPAKPALPVLLVQMEKGLTPHDRLDAAEAVWRLLGDVKLVLPLVRTVLESKDGDWAGPAMKARAIAILGLMCKAGKDAAPALAAAIRAEDEADARATFHITPIKADEEDESRDTIGLLRRTGLPVLRQLAAAAAKALEVPVK